jgi:hypothetical protein
MSKNPSFQVMAVLILATHIGSTTAMFSLMSAVMLQPFPDQKPRELVLLGRGRQIGVDMGFPGDKTELFSYPFYRRLHRETRAIAE